MRSFISNSLVISTLALTFVPCAVFAADDATMPAAPTTTTTTTVTTPVTKTVTTPATTTVTTPSSTTVTTTAVDGAKDATTTVTGTDQPAVEVKSKKATSTKSTTTKSTTTSKSKTPATTKSSTTTTSVDKTTEVTAPAAVDGAKAAKANADRIVDTNDPVIDTIGD